MPVLATWTPADAALMMQLGCDGVFVGSGIFKSPNPEKQAKAIVQAAADAVVRGVTNLRRRFSVDVVVLGSGAAGLSAALAVRPVRSVLVVTKDILSAGSTQWAQGGLAGVLDPTDVQVHASGVLYAVAQ